MLPLPVGRLPQIAQALVKLGMEAHHRRAVARHPLPQFGDLKKLVAVTPGRESRGEGSALAGIAQKV